MNKQYQLVFIALLLVIFLLFSGCTDEQNGQDNNQSDDNGSSNGGTQDQNNGDEGNETDDGGSQNPPDILLWMYSSDCTNSDDFTFDVSPIAVDDITYIEPLGELTDNVAGHIIPGDHIGIHYEFGPTVPGVDVYALADGYLVMAERHVYTPPGGYPSDMRHYHLYFEYTCSIYTGYVHVTEIAQELLDASEELYELNAKDIERNENLYQRIPITSGQKIGTSSAFGMLGMITIDTRVTNTGLIKPESYTGQNWRYHAVAPFEYFTEPLKTQIYEKVPRTADPQGGQFNYDIDGRLVGNWFKEGTNGIDGVDTYIPGECGNMVCPYWDGHLAIVYDFVEPHKVRINIGRDTGISAQCPYGVKGNAPDPASIAVADGVIEYELVDLLDVSADHGYEIKGGNPLFTENDESTVLGVFMVQMIDDETIKVEVFPNETADTVDGFTDNALIYVR